MPVNDENLKKAFAFFGLFGILGATVNVIALILLG